MMRRIKKEENYLEWIPEKNTAFESKTDEKGNVAILVRHKGVFFRVTQFLLGKPKTTWVHFDKMGNFIWPLIDGERTVYEIAQFVREQFGEQAEPLYERLAIYMKLLERYSFIRMQKTG